MYLPKCQQSKYENRTGFLIIIKFAQGSWNRGKKIIRPISYQYSLAFFIRLTPFVANSSEVNLNLFHRSDVPPLQWMCCETAPPVEKTKFTVFIKPRFECFFQCFIVCLLRYRVWIVMMTSFCILFKI